MWYNIDDVMWMDGRPFDWIPFKREDGSTGYRWEEVILRDDDGNVVPPSMYVQLLHINKTRNNKKKLKNKFL